MTLRDEASQISAILTDLVTSRQEAAPKIAQNQEHQKRNFDKRRKKARKYKAGDLLVLIATNIRTTSREVGPAKRPVCGAAYGKTTPDQKEGRLRQSHSCRSDETPMPSWKRFRCHR
ncbi:hypothetical protein Zmor_001278 [Zophobas morio]|uniref:Uncharacterized protein n=1 Tax=Zophobas morio TaxID=2755281 RepID=A0AA38J8K4_9CUCU|nr:hypothetical protein Zmor_001278 [Zophobas morio]